MSRKNLKLPEFPIDSANITVLYNPNDFLERLIDMYENAEKRIVLSTLYIGTQSKERKIIQAIRKSILKQKSKLCSDISKCTVNINSINDVQKYVNKKGISCDSRSYGDAKQFQVDILMDALRGSRSNFPLSFDSYEKLKLLCTSDPFSCLYDLFQEQYILDSFDPINNNMCANTSTSETNDENCEKAKNGTTKVESLQNACIDINMNFFHSPLLSGYLHSILPERVNEILGVFHSKIYMADDTVILTGANLSESYLTNRQDRYIVLTNVPELCDFLHKCVKEIQKFSYRAYLVPKSYDCENPNVKSYLYSVNDEFVIQMKLPVDTPNPITHPEEFSKSMGQSLSCLVSNYVKEQSNTQCNSLTSSGIQPTDSQLYVALQAGFTQPQINDEVTLMNSTLKSRYGSNKQCSELSHGYIESYLMTLRILLTQLCIKFIHQILSFICSKSHIEDFIHSNSTSYHDASQLNSTNSHQALYPSLLDFQPSKIVISSGYLNISNFFLYLLVNCIPPPYIPPNIDSKYNENSCLEIFIASPQANSFYQSKGLSKYIPKAYSYLGKKNFVDLCKKWTSMNTLGQDNSLISILKHWKNGIKNFLNMLSRAFFQKKNRSRLPTYIVNRPRLWEYNRPGWTFHSKGIWFYSNDGNSDKVCGPKATIIGSSNYGLRSYARDLEISFLLNTKSERLQKDLQKEIDLIRKGSKAIDNIYHFKTYCPRWLKLLLGWIQFRSLL